MNILYRKFLFIAFVFSACLSASAIADEMIMARSERDFSEAMNVLQQAITEHGYTLAKVQRIDVGLEAKGYKTDQYRVVFYGKPEEIASLSEHYPQLIPFLPLSVAIFAEGNQTMLATTRPRAFKALFTDKALQSIFEHWDSDLVSIFEEVRQSH